MKGGIRECGELELDVCTALLDIRVAAGGLAGLVAFLVGWGLEMRGLGRWGKGALGGEVGVWVMVREEGG